MSEPETILRLHHLAIEAAQGHHYGAAHDYSTDTWAHHTCDFATCPHPDCVLVREWSSGDPPPQQRTQRG